MKTIAVYGSLKRGRYNHDLIKDGKYLGTGWYQGTMYSLGSYPAIVDEGVKPYMVELFQVDDKTFDAVSYMEITAGYLEKEIDIEYTTNDKEKKKTKAVIYIAGDFLSSYCKNKKQIINVY